MRKVAINQPINPIVSCSTWGIYLYNLLIHHSFLLSKTINQREIVNQLVLITYTVLWNLILFLPLSFDHWKKTRLCMNNSTFHQLWSFSLMSLIKIKLNKNVWKKLHLIPFIIHFVFGVILVTCHSLSRVKSFTDNSKSKTDKLSNWLTDQPLA